MNTSLVLEGALPNWFLRSRRGAIAGLRLPFGGKSQIATKHETN
jgi:hypothetical protein